MQNTLIKTYHFLRNFILKKVRYFFIIKYQTSFFRVYRYSHKVFFKKKIFYHYKNFYLEKKNIITKKKLFGDFKKLIIFFYNTNSSKLYYLINNKKYSKLASRNSINFLKLDLKNKKSLSLLKENNIEYIRTFYIKKKTKRRLVLLLMLDGFSNAMLPNLNKSRKYFNDNYLNNVWNNAEWTLPSFGNLISGKYSQNHKCYDPSSYFIPNHLSKKINCYKNIFETFSQNDFVTGCYTGYNRINPTYGLTKGVDILKHTINESAPEIIDNIIGQLEMFNDTSNLIFSHFNDGHHLLKGYKDLAMASISDDHHQSHITKSENLNKKNVFKVYDGVNKEFKMSLYKYADFKLEILYNYLDKKNYDDYTIILFGDHGSRFFDDRYLLSNQQCNIGFFIKDKKNNFEKSKLVQTIDIFPSLVNRYFNSKNNFTNFQFDGINSLYSKNKNSFSLSESIYLNKYEIAIRANNAVHYSVYKKNENFNLSDEKTLLFNSDLTKKINDEQKEKNFLKIRNHHLKKLLIK